MSIVCKTIMRMYDKGEKALLQYFKQKFEVRLKYSEVRLKYVKYDWSTAKYSEVRLKYGEVQVKYSEVQWSTHSWSSAFSPLMYDHAHVD
jgi:hypothetical protein